MHLHIANYRKTDCLMITFISEYTALGGTQEYQDNHNNVDLWREVYTGVTPQGAKRTTLLKWNIQWLSLQGNYHTYIHMFHSMCKISCILHNVSLYQDTVLYCGPIIIQLCNRLLFRFVITKIFHKKLLFKLQTCHNSQFFL